MSNTIKQGAVKEKGHTAVSLPRALAAEVTAAADLSGRSAAKQLEHAFRIAQAIEQLLPTATVHVLKSGALPVSQLLVGLAAVLKAPAESTALAEAMEQNPLQIHFDRNDPTIAYQQQADGKLIEGRLMENGDFVPNLHPESASSRESVHHVTKEGASRPPTKRSTGRKSNTKLLEHA